MRYKIYCKFLSLLTFFFMFQALPSWSQDAAPVEPEKHINFYVSDGPLLTRGETNHFGAILFVELDQGWHTYWRVPGDAGLAPRFDWSKSENIKDPKIGWVTPTRIIENDFQIFGYKDTAIFPVTFSAEDPAKEAVLDLNMDILICNEICVPEKLHTTLKFKPEDIKPDEAALTNWDAVVDRLPLKDAENDNLEIENVVLGPDALVITAFAKDGFENADLFAVTGDYAFTSTPEIKPEPSNPERAMIIVEKPDDVESLAGFLTGKKLELTLVSGETSIEKSFDF